MEKTRSNSDIISDFVINHMPQLMDMASKRLARYGHTLGIEAEDLVQETLFHVYSCFMKEGAEQIAPDTLLHFVSRTMKNTLIDRTRKVSGAGAAKHPAVNALEKDDFFIPDHDPTPFESAAANDVVARIMGAIPKAQRPLVWARAVEEISRSEIAARMGATDAAIKSRYQRAIAAAGKELAFSTLGI